MPVIDGRLTCCQCGSDLGDAEDAYADPSCGVCLREEMERECEDDSEAWVAEGEALAANRYGDCAIVVTCLRQKVQ